MGPLSEEDDEPELEIVVSPAPELRPAANGTSPQGPRRNPRQIRNDADDVVESGEIPARRSLIIRAPKVETFEDDATEITALPRPPAPAPMRAAPRSRRYLMWLAGAVVAGGVAIAAPMLLPPSATAVEAPLSTKDLEVTATMIGALFDAEQAQTLGRAEVIAASPMIGAAIETDAQTLSDMASGEDMILPREPAQVIEVHQIVNGTVTVLLRLPADAEPLAATGTGTATVVVRDGVAGALASAAIPPRRGVGGSIVTWRPIDLGPATKRLVVETRGATLGGLSAPIPIVPHASPVTTQLPVPTTRASATPLVLAATVVPVTTVTTRNPARVPQLASAGVAALMLIMFAISALGARRARAA